MGDGETESKRLANGGEPGATMEGRWKGTHRFDIGVKGVEGSGRIGWKMIDGGVKMEGGEGMMGDISRHGIGGEGEMDGGWRAQGVGGMDMDGWE